MLAMAFIQLRMEEKLGFPGDNLTGDGSLKKSGRKRVQLNVKGYQNILTRT